MMKRMIQQYRGIAAFGGEQAATAIEGSNAIFNVLNATHSDTKIGRQRND
jgi:hypothetical protein